MPTGGLEDTLPPQVIGSKPGNYSVGFVGKSIEIEFSEFIKLEKINQQALISPPLQKMPEFRLKGKKLLVKFDEDLKPETTYTIFFGDAIVDLTESNPLSSYTFVFSTGSVLDSMALKGKVHMAFDDVPAEGAFVFLYRIEEDTIPVDSLPFFKKPYYVARTDKKGNFRFRNLRNEPYRMYALEDRNSNFLYDKGGEGVAFSSEIVQPEYLEYKKTDSDSLGVFSLQDSAVIDHKDHKHARITAVNDSLVYAARLLADSLAFAKLRLLKLSMFYEVDSTQKLLRAEVVRKGQLNFSFRYPAENVLVEPITTLPDSLKLIRMYSAKKDTLTWFFRDSIVDSVQVLVKMDTLFHDTLRLAMTPKVVAAAKRSQKKAASTSGLSYTTPISGRRLDIGKTLDFSFPEPVIHYQMRDTNRWIAKGDTTYNQLKFVKVDSIGLKYRLDFQAFEPEGDYQLRMPDSVFFGLSGATNDTIDLAFKVPALSDYGNLMLDVIPDFSGQMLIQLLTPKGDVVEQRSVQGRQKLSFSQMKPAKFVVKAIFDENANGRWDTGDLVAGKQPESVVYLDKELEIRANWDLEEEWKVSLSKEVLPTVEPKD